MSHSTETERQFGRPSETTSVRGVGVLRIRCVVIDAVHSLRCVYNLLSKYKPYFIQYGSLHLIL